MTLETIRRIDKSQLLRRYLFVIDPSRNRQYHFLINVRGLDNITRACSLDYTIHHPAPSAVDDFVPSHEGRGHNRLTLTVFKGYAIVRS
ncbi:hypothetical protein SORDD17_00584 [Streptococcus oralis]|uniref:Uncharacterized protein n=1 Tax=Streptococcus oralis TaxID=1303 RepID=A0A139RNA9_STROR|nr:hypothetical protein SORDD17_00584 [Streptococcus oralis]